MITRTVWLCDCKTITIHNAGTSIKLIQQVIKSAGYGRGYGILLCYAHCLERK